jgi:hypothetical protein
MKHSMGQNAHSTTGTRTWTCLTPISWLLTHWYFLGQRTYLRQTIGSAPLNQSSVCYTALSMRRRCMLHNSWEVQQGTRGHPTLQHCQQITMYHGMSSMLPSVVTTCSGHSAQQAFRVSGSTPREPFSVWVHSEVHQLGIVLPHLEIPISEREPFSWINLKFWKDFIWFKLMILFVF